ncbi:MAG: hypothetical protein CBC35_06515 [Planctomycetes bacterium TMED75]|nr:hypothetical protein [Planctomycetaceae bacterium]OUU92955.1 MAG: hypothetical protein CBC35_06515 [Planctomycetes bacterium TMED75]
MSVTKSLILILLLLPMLLFSCSTTPGGKSLENRVQSQRRVEGHKARLNLEQAYRAYSHGMFEKAMKFAEQARQRTPDDPQPYMLLARICLEDGRLEASDRLLGEVLKLNPNIPDAHYLRGVVYQRWSRDQQALDAYLSAWNTDPNSVYSVHYLLAAGETLVDMHQYDRARELLLPKLSFFENNAAMHHLLGTIHVLTNEHDVAIHHLQQAHMIGGSDEIIMADLARSQLVGGHFHDCLRTLEKIENTLKDESPSWLYELRARCFLEMGSPRDARSTYVQLLRIDPENITAWIDYGATAHEIGDLGRLDTCADRLIALAPGRMEGYLYKGFVAMEAGQTPAARSWFKRADQNAAGGQTMPLLALAQLEMVAGNRDAARSACIRALRERSDDSQTRAYIQSIATGSLDNLPD